jgi:hypothetical protein
MLVSPKAEQLLYLGWASGDCRFLTVRQNSAYADETVATVMRALEEALFIAPLAVTTTNSHAPKWALSGTGWRRRSFYPL